MAYWEVLGATPTVSHRGQRGGDENATSCSSLIFALTPNFSEISL
jgi:hypothetical protein